MCGHCRRMVVAIVAKSLLKIGEKHEGLKSFQQFFR